MADKHQFTGALWPESPKAKSFPTLQENKEVDVAIVGGGITGITAAGLLARAGEKVAVLEAFEVGKGTTGSSTGNLYVPIDEQLFSIQSKHSVQTLQAVVASRAKAIDFIEQQVNQYHIDCDFQRVPFHLFTTPETSKRNKDIEKEYNATAECGLDALQEPPPDFPFPVEHILTLPSQAQFNPLKYVQELAASVNSDDCHIYENTQVTHVTDGKPCTIETSSGVVVKAKKVIMATHTPKGVYAVHTAMEPYREYAMAVKLRGPLPEPGAYWHMLKDQHYSIRPVRNENSNYLLALGEAHKVGNKEENEENLKKIETYLRNNFDVESVAYTWAAQNYKPADNIPYIGTSPMQQDVFIATGFAADGLVYGSLAAMIIKDLIINEANPLAKLYSPTRFTPAASAKKFAKENLTVGTHLLKDHLAYGEVDELKAIRPGEGKTIMLQDERLAAYRDDAGKLQIVSGICPHMGCVVHWNSAEKSWDCPCHGSRFDVDGKVLEGPAYKGLARPKNSANTQ